ncbi:MAG: fibronectin type III domain-containing protein [bacterium]
MKKFFLLFLTLIILSISAHISVFAQTKLDPKIYDKYGFRLDQKLHKPATSTPSILSIASSTLLKATSTLVKPDVPPVDLSAFKQGEAASCFDYYTFGSIAVNLSTDASTYSPGDVVILRGEIKNNNKYPITNLTVRARLVKDIPNPDYLRSEIITLQDFNIVENITLDAGKSFAVNYSHLLPLNSPKGEYKLLFYAYNNDRFEQSGLSFSNISTAQSLRFKVVGNNPQQVYLDQTKITVNDMDYNVIGPIPEIAKSNSANISIPLVNPTGKDEKMTITYSLYKWDDLLDKNKVDSKVENITVSANSKVNLLYKVVKTDMPIYYLNIKSDKANANNDLNKKSKTVFDIQTESNVRFAVAGYDYPRINSFGVNTYPIVAGQDISLFTCYNNAAKKDTQSNVNISTILYDDKNNIISKTQYDGKINGSISAIFNRFKSKRDIVNFKAEVVITDSAGNIIDKIENNYNCKDINPKICPAEINNNSAWIILFFLILIVFMIIIFYVKIKSNKRKSVNLISMIFTIIFTIIPSLMFAHTSEAATRRASLDFYMDSSANGAPDSIGLVEKEFNFNKSGINLSDVDLNVLNVGESIDASSPSAVGSWYFKGYPLDHTNMDGSKYMSSDTYDFSTTYVDFSMGTPIEVGDTNISSDNPSVVSCISNKCTAVGPGTANINVSFADKENETSNDIKTCDVFDFTYKRWKGDYLTPGRSYGYGLAPNCVPGRLANAGMDTSFVRSHFIPYYDSMDEALFPTYAYSYFDNIRFFPGPSKGFGIVNTLLHIYVDHTDFADPDSGSSDWSIGAAQAFSFDPIKYAITVPSTINATQTSACTGVTNISQSSATVNWSYVDPEGDPQTNFQVQISVDSTFADSSIVNSVAASANTDASSVRSVSIQGLTSNTTYFCRVRTLNTANGWSEYNNCSNSFITTGNNISAPTISGPHDVSLGVPATYTASSSLAAVTKKENDSFFASVFFALKKVFAQTSTETKLVYQFDWNNDGIIDYSSDPVLPGVEVQASNTWNTKGDFIFKARATEPVSGVSSDWVSFNINVSDKPKVQALFYCVSPNLSWGAVPNAISYDFEVKNKTDLTSVHKTITGLTVDISQYLNNTNISFGVRAIYSGNLKGDQTWVNNITPTCPKLGDSLNIKSGMIFGSNPPWANETTKKCAYFGQIDPTIVMSDEKTYTGIVVKACSIDGISVSLSNTVNGGKGFENIPKNVGNHILSCNLDYDNGIDANGAVIRSNATTVLSAKCSNLANTVEK